MSETLRLAIKARIPVVKITTDDPVSLVDLLNALGDGREQFPWVPGNLKKDNVIFWSLVNEQVVGTVNHALYNDYLSRGNTLILVNDIEDEYPFIMDCGIITGTVDYVSNQLSEFLSVDQVEKFGRYFIGLSFTKVIETIMLTQSRDGALTANGINETKAYLGQGISGLEVLSTEQSNYVAPDWIAYWMEHDAPFLDRPDMLEFWPKGFMLHGPAGTGKTEAAIFIAGELDLPLFRIDAGGLYSRWQGGSEDNLKKILSFITSQGECVFLIDEADKLFGKEADGQVSLSTMLSMLLWWLQGPSNKAVTVMTANKLDVIPPELYRPGRLDSVHLMEGIAGYENRADFVSRAILKYQKYNIDLDVLNNNVLESPLLNNDQPIPQAELIGVIRKEAKKLILEKGM